MASTCHRCCRAYPWVPRHTTHDTNRYDHDNRDLAYWVAQCPPSAARLRAVTTDDTLPVPPPWWRSPFLPWPEKAEPERLRWGPRDSSVSVPQSRGEDTRTSGHSPAEAPFLVVSPLRPGSDRWQPDHGANASERRGPECHCSDIWWQG